MTRKAQNSILAILAHYVPFLPFYTADHMPRHIWSWQNALGLMLLVAALVSGAATYAALNEVPPFGNDPDTVIWLLTLDMVLLLALVALIGRRVVAIWSGRKQGLAGSHLHVRLVYIFSFMAAVPAVVMSVCFVFFFYYGIQTWFSQSVQTAVNESQAVAEAYLEEHKQVIRADTLAMATDIDRQATYFMINEGAFKKSVETQSILRNLSEALVFDSSGRVLASSGLTFSLEFESIPNYALEQARNGEVVIMTGSNDDRVRALIRLGSFIDAYLFVGRMVDPKVLSHLTATRQASAEYTDLQKRSSRLQIMVTMIFSIIGLLLMFAAIWFGFILARQLVNPISELITTADKVRAGDLSVRVPEFGSIEEFDYLGRSFNRMTTQIQEQQNALLDANTQLDRRRRFTETVLAGVTSGVLGVDTAGRVKLANNPAAKLLGYDPGRLQDKAVAEISEEFGALLREAHEKPLKITQGEIPVLQRKDGSRRIFLVRIAIELVDERDVGAIITFDDITDLQSAQRKAAWADVARRIAHEIKNPLTPIQLSAERLKRKYLKQIKDDPDTFSQCTDTIIRHVEDIGRMVAEFSSFARMPEPDMRLENVNEAVRDAVFLHKQAHGDITFSCAGLDADEYLALFDVQQIRQALNNLIQNAVDSIHARLERDGQTEEGVGRIHVIVAPYTQDQIYIGIGDNGLGLPQDEAPNSLTEPYVTHKVKGTGLGLAIVKKIMEDHNGALVLGVEDWITEHDDWQDLGGASVGILLELSKEKDEKGQAPVQKAPKVA